MNAMRIMGATAAAALMLAGCSSGTDAPVVSEAGGGATSSATASGGGTMDSGAGTMLETAQTDLGTIVVDGDGMTVYQFDSDTQGSGSSTCTGGCLTNWPPVPAGSDVAAEAGNGITGELGSITGTDGAPQLTLNGWPLYYFAGDSAAGDVNGQAVSNVWWVLTPAGEPIRG
ncbi:COG4315 family predicted lipoprotein [Demequina capsici]|uniref:Lipoprotein with Yx(FWY)xxD motif n=1 Tax=Demequina capsici TaxID=3075620 RepID=A0AA96F415_9MICO|nr:hypothetical protein [Demequina sp. OYTSA14]WNM23508.1 hypothetical protein RN606_09015 [Demequina sp. OYTSA14]